jgi:hypothetical protein
MRSHLLSTPRRSLAVGRWAHCVLALTLVALFVVRFAASAGATTYYVSPAGSDRGPGTSTRHPWRTLARVDKRHLRPGDRLLLRGGAVFSGTLRVVVDGKGSARRPVLVGSYGGGRATIDAGRGSGVEILDSGGVRIDGLILDGSGASSNTGSGVLALNNLPGAVKLHMLRIEHVQAGGFGFAGIAVYGKPADRSQSGYENVTISDCAASNNRFYGVYVDGAEDPSTSSYANSDVTIRGCLATDNLGDSDYPQSHSGDGIFLGDVTGGLIDGSIAHGNGTLNSCEGCGPVGIWAANAHNVTIEHSESYENAAGPGGHDGDGFDLDGGSTNCVLQYNYSHENDGSGFVIYGYAGAPHRESANTIRFNVSRNDARRGGYPAILLAGEGQAATESAVYNNSVYLEPPVGGMPSAVEVLGEVGGRIFNNLLVTSDGLPLVSVPSPRSGLSFQGNDYWSSGAPLEVSYAGTSYSSIASWSAATGQESVSGASAATSIEPGLTSAGVPSADVGP